MVRCITVVAANLIPEDEIPPEGPQQMSLFVDYDALEKKKEQEKAGMPTVSITYFIVTRIQIRISCCRT